MPRTSQYGLCTDALQLDRETVAYFRSIAEEAGIPYQSLINLYLRDCAVHHRKLHMKWAS